MKTRIFLLGAVLISTFASNANATWEPNRNANGRVVVDNMVFDYERSGGDIFSGFSVGHNIPNSRNHLFYNLNLDGYGGLPSGSCLTRSALMPDNDPTKSICAANENKDIMRVWANRNPLLENVLLKNMTIQNAFRTFNVVDGVVVTSSRELPHTDTFQTFYNSTASENADWLVIQDTVIKNSDNNLMISGSARFGGVVYQNLSTGCEAAFLQDARQRFVNDHLEFTGNTNPTSSHCNNAMRVGTTGPAPVWLINVSPGNNGDARVDIINDLARVIVVGNSANQFDIRTRNANRQQISHPNVHYYDFIEDAIAAEGNANRPPFIELSCSGWRNPPNNCETRLGFLDDDSDPVNTDGGGDGGSGEPDGSDRPDDGNPPSDNNSPGNSNARPIHHWRLDETTGLTARNSSGTANGSLNSINSNQWQTANARVGQSALRFDGGQERVLLNGLDVSGSSISMMGWIRSSDVDAANSEARIISKATGNNSQQHYWMLSLDENGSNIVVPRVRLRIGNTTRTLLGSNASEVQQNQWVHIAATFDGDTIRLYSNAEEVARLSAQGSLSSNAAVPTAIGNQPSGGRGFEGLIDDVCIFDQAVSPAELRFIYNNGSGRSCERIHQSGSQDPNAPTVDDLQPYYLPAIVELLLGERDS